VAWWGHWRPGRITGDQDSLLDTRTVHWRPGRITGDQDGSLKTRAVHWRPGRITGDQDGPLETRTVHWRPGQTTGDQDGTLGWSQDIIGLVGGAQGQDLVLLSLLRLLICNSGPTLVQLVPPLHCLAISIHRYIECILFVCVCVYIHLYL